MKRIPFLARVLVAVAAVGLLAGACGDDDEATDSSSEQPASELLTITDPWSRQPADGQTATAVYGVLSNPSDTDVRVVSAASPVTGTVELHETLMDDDGVMSMQEVEEGFVVPAGGEFTFEPGGPHIMLLGIDPATYPTTVEITLTFDSGDPLTFSAEVREVESSMDMGDSDMSHDDMGDSDMSDSDMDMDMDMDEAG
ncbi:MAG: copper chaperone PCu(A)C [Acidimicrobiales bacterium]